MSGTRPAGVQALVTGDRLVDVAGKLLGIVMRRTRYRTNKGTAMAYLYVRGTDGIDYVGRMAAQARYVTLWKQRESEHD